MGISPYLANVRTAVGHMLLVVPSVAVLPWDDHGRLLLVRQVDTGQWATVGGAVDPDESPRAAALREVWEEAAVSVVIEGIRDVIGGPEFRIRYPNGDETAYVSTVFDARVVAGDPHPDEDEVSDVGWFSPDDLRAANLSDFTRSLLVSVGALTAGTS